MSAFSASLLVGKLLLAAFGDRFDPRFVRIGLLVAQGVALLLTVNPREPWQLGAVALGIGAANGGTMVALTTVLSNYFGTGLFPLLAGFAFSASTLGTAITPLLAGHLYDMTGNYDIPFHTAAAGCLLGALGLMILRRPIRPRSALGRASSGSAQIDSPAQ